MINVDLNLPETLVRKMKALSALKGSGSFAQGFETYVVTLLDEAVTGAILSELGGDLRLNYEEPEAAAPQQEESPRGQYYKDASEISDGLGDDMEDLEDVEETTPMPVGSMYDLIPKSGGISEKALDEDMDVEDPEHEAKAEPPRVVSNARPEQIFSSFVGLPLPAEEDDADNNWASKRKKRVRSKARVSPATGYEREIE